MATQLIDQLFFHSVKITLCAWHETGEHHIAVIANMLPKAAPRCYALANVRLAIFGQPEVDAWPILVGPRPPASGTSLKSIFGAEEVDES